MRLGGSRGPVCLPCAHLGSPGASLLVGEQGGDKSSSGPVSISGEYEEVGISGSELKQSLREGPPSLSKECSCPREPCCPRGLSCQPALPCPRNCIPRWHPPVQILNIAHFKKEAVFVETKENTVFLRKIKKKNLNCL